MSITIEDKEMRHCLRKKNKCCKISGCKIRGRYNYGREYFYHGFCKKHYSQYQEGIIDFHGNPIRPSLQGIKDVEKYTDFRKRGKRWNKTDHIEHNLRCKICGCERPGEISHGKMRYFKGMCAYHYRQWYLKGFIDSEGNIITGPQGEKPKKKKCPPKRAIITRQMVKYFKRVRLSLG